MIIGRSLAATFPPRPPAPPAAARRSSRRATSRPAASSKDVSFALQPGEILGVAGLQGMGQRELFLACFGMATSRRGRDPGRRPAGDARPRRATRSAPNIGISLVPEDRKTEGLFLKLDGRSNASMPVDRPLHRAAA